MPDGPDADAKHSGTNFREAIATWRLALHTEVKKTSALPTAMFDACDPMLETRLVDATEALLGLLRQPGAELLDEAAPEQELRLEAVALDEVRALPTSIAAVAPAQLDLQSDLAAEYLTVLAETCHSASGPVLQDAVRVICEAFGVTPAADLEALATVFVQLVENAAATNEPAAADIAAICRHIAAAVTVRSATTQPVETET